MTKTLLASLLVATACAGSPKKIQPLDGDDMVDRIDRVPATCSQSGAVRFEIAHAKDAGDSVTSSLKIYGEGMDHGWTLDDSTGAHRAGCLSQRKYEELDQALRASAWKLERADVTCMANSPEFIDYMVDGKKVWTDRICTPEHLDADSRGHLDEAIRVATQAAGIAASQ